MKKIAIYILSFFLFSGYYAGLAIIIVTGLTELSRFYSIPIRILQLALMIFLMRYIFINKIKIDYFLPFILFTVFYFFKVFYTESQLVTSEFLPLMKSWQEYIFYFVIMTFLPIIAFASFDFKKYARLILNSIILSTFLLSIVTLYFYSGAIGSGVGRISLIVYQDSETESTISPLALSYGSALGISLCSYALLFQNNSFYRKFFLFLVIALSVVIFFLGASRGSLVAIILSVFILIYYSDFKRKLLITILSFLSIPVLFIVADKIGSNLFERTENTIEDGDSSGRNALWNDAWNHFLDNPILGGRIEVSGIYPHNMFLETLMATGIVGLLLFSPAIFASFKNASKLIKVNKIFLIPFIIFINGFLQNMFSGAIYNMMVMSAGMGILLSSINKRKIFNDDKV